LADDSDDDRRLGQAEFRAITSAKLPPTRNHPNVWRRTSFLVALATHLRGKSLCQEPNLHLDSTNNQRQPTISAASGKKSAAQDICYY
jgi:hypothetical protein